MNTYVIMCMYYTLIICTIYHIIHTLYFYRRATTVWQWPYCISVEEKTFEQLVKLVEQYWDMKNHTPTPPFLDMK